MHTHISDILANRAKDWISCLPEDVTGFILSLLTSREAQATCLLSRRWRHLSTCRVTNLDINRSDLFAEMKDHPELAEKERARYVEWVDNVLHSQSGGYHLHKFALRFDLSISYHNGLWSFKDLRSDDPSHLPCLLGHETLMDADIGCSQRASGLSNFGSSPSSSWHVGFRYLEELTLNRVAVEREFIEQLLANCPVQERLILVFARTVDKFRVCGRSLKLKYLHIGCCHDLECLELYDTYLVSFTFVGEPILLCLDKLPKLSEVSITGPMLELVKVMLPKPSSLPCLQILILKFIYSPNQGLLIDQLPKLTSVKQLKLRVTANEDVTLLPLTALIEACPCLQSFVFELMHPANMLCKQRELERVVGCPPHRYLKEVEFYNYYGQSCDLELVIYLVENAIALEKLVVNPYDEEFDSSEWEK